MVTYRVYIFLKNWTAKIRKKKSPLVKSWLKNCMYTRAFNNIFAELMVDAKEELVDTVIHDSEKKSTPIYLSNFFEYNTKDNFIFAVCSCPSYTFLLIFADAIDDKRTNQP